MPEIKPRTSRNIKAIEVADKSKSHLGGHDAEWRRYQTSEEGEL